MAKRNLKRTKLLLPSRKAVRKQFEQNLPEEIRIQKELRELERKTREKWLKQNEHFSSEQFIKQWDKTRDDTKQRFVQTVVKYLAIGDGAVEANSMFKHGMKLSEVSIDLKELSSYIDKLTRIDLLIDITNGMALSKKAKEEMIVRIIAREFPMFDNTAVQTNPKVPRNMTAQYYSKHQADKE